MCSTVNKHGVTQSMSMIMLHKPTEGSANHQDGGGGRRLCVRVPMKRIDNNYINKRMNQRNISTCKLTCATVWKLFSMMYTLMYGLICTLIIEYKHLSNNIKTRMSLVIECYT